MDSYLLLIEEESNLWSPYNLSASEKFGWYQLSTAFVQMSASNILQFNDGNGNHLVSAYSSYAFFEDIAEVPSVPVVNFAYNVSPSINTMGYQWTNPSIANFTFITAMSLPLNSPTSSYFIFFGDNLSGNLFLPIIQVGDTRTELFRGASTMTVRINGSSYTPIYRQDLYNALDQWNIISFSFTGVNTSLIKGFVPSLSNIGVHARFAGDWIITNGVASLSTIEKCEGYIAHKIGLANLLDINHPYKNNPPLIV